MRPTRRLVPDAAVTAAAARIEHQSPPVPDDLLGQLTDAVTALLEEGWTIEEVAVVHHLAVSDLTTLDGVVQRPAVLTVALHWAREHPLWWHDTESGDVHASDLSAWGVSAELAEELAQWNSDLGRSVLAESDSRSDQAAGAARQAADVLHRRGYELALRLQEELWDVEVRYALTSSPARPVREQHP